VRRRECIRLFGVAALAWPVIAHAQQSDRIRLVGVLMGFAENDPVARSCLAAFRNALAKLGWTEGNNLRLEVRWTADDTDTMRTLAKELVDLRPDAILSQTTPVTGALARETPTIPIVFVTVSDPLGSGFVTSFARPGGNITGFALFEPSMGGKWLELLKEIAPRTVRVALLFNPATAVPLKIYMPSIQAAASSLDIQVSAAPVHAKEEIEGVIASQARNPGGGLIVPPDSFTTGNGELISTLAARYGVPVIHNAISFPQSGGLIAFGTDFVDQFRQASGYIDRILKGAKPGDLPIQQPTKYALVINIKTAKALGLDIPFYLQQRADELIE